MLKCAAMLLAVLAGACAAPASQVVAAPPQADAPPFAAAAVPSSGIDFTKATPIDKDYRQKFVDCDEHNTFRGAKMKGRKECGGDRNNLTRLVSFPAVPGLPGTVVAFTSKLGVDYDG